MLDLPDVKPISKEKANQLKEKLIGVQPLTKMVIVVRKDLNMRQGKACAQAAHAATNAIFQLMFGTLSKESFTKIANNELIAKYTEEFKAWVLGNYTKICVCVNSERELVEIYEKAKLEGLNAVLVVDKGFTEFHGVPTKTCIAIGPDYNAKIDKITKNLKLL